jgi:hypothetical protein
MLPGALRAHLILMHGQGDTADDIEHEHTALHRAGLATVTHTHEGI